jgi:hypothetical protein
MLFVASSNKELNLTLAGKPLCCVTQEATQLTEFSAHGDG